MSADDLNFDPANPYGADLDHDPGDPGWHPPTGPTLDARQDAERAEQEAGGAHRMAYRLATAYADRLMHVPGLGWFHWTGTHWAEDKGAKAAKRAVSDVLRRAWREAMTDRALERDVKACQSATGFRGVLEVAESLPTFAVDVDDLDADPGLLNTPGGLVNLETGDVHPHDPAARCTHITAGSYRPGCVEGSEWETFLESTLPDPEVRAFLARWAGLGLLGEVREHKLVILTGEGRNGKGVLYQALDAALGDYAVIGEKELLLHRDNAHPTGEMDLMGARWVVISETDRGRKLAEATVKRLTGGDKIKARKMRQDYVEFAPSHSLTLVTNHLPEVEGDETALWDRLRVVKFTQAFRGQDADPDLPNRLRSEAEADAVVTWAVQGWFDYRGRGRAGDLAEPPAVLAATGNYRDSSDTLGDFLDACTEAPVQGPVGSQVLHDAYTRWAVARRVKPLNKNDFSAALERRELVKKKTSAGFVWPSLALKSEWRL